MTLWSWKIKGPKSKFGRNIKEHRNQWGILEQGYLMVVGFASTGTRNVLTLVL